MAESLAIASATCGNAVIASRLKRIDTIINKLERDSYRFKLHELNDIAGCRLIVDTIEELRTVQGKLEALTNYRGTADYVACPQESGYRGIHVFHRCDSPLYHYENLRVETQLRTRLQHAWATAVETFDELYGTQLKFGETCDASRYFQIVSSLFASIEQTDPASSRANASECVELRDIENRLHITAELEGWSGSIGVLEGPVTPFDYALMKIDLNIQLLELHLFDKLNAERAYEEYSQKERNEQEEGVIFLLVKASSVEKLREAYPNYYSDIACFVDNVHRFLAP